MRILQASPSAETAYGLAQGFMRMIREHTGQPLDSWLNAVEESHLPELKSFARGIQQDKAAVKAGLTLSWSQGPHEGHVNRLKLMKRSMYGRAKFDLLRLRIPYRPKANQGIQKKNRQERHPKQKTETYTLSLESTAMLIEKVA